MNPLTIHWQRLVTGGRTCDRCADTGAATEAAIAKLGRCLAELGIDVQLVTGQLDLPAFAAAPLESNRILIDGRTLEQWLGGATGQSPCCGACGDAECRTITVDGVTHEAVPERLILRAGLLAAAERLR
jgi:hypothetical protein